MRITVPPSLRLGPPASGLEAEVGCRRCLSPWRSRESLLNKGRRTSEEEVRGRPQASTDWRAGLPRGARRGSGEPGSTRPWRLESLKDLIEAACEIEVGRQRFFFKQTALINDELSLKSFGIGDGDLLKLRILKHGSHVGAVRSLRQRGDRLAGKYDGWTLSNTKHIKQCRSTQGAVYMQPRWNKVPPQSEPQISLAAGCSYSSRNVTGEVLAHPIYVKDPNDSQMRSLRKRLSVL